jgi:hypothetical protein
MDRYEANPYMKEYIFEKSPNMCDLYEDRFDITWSTSLEKTDKVFTILSSELLLNKNLVDDKSIIYKYNNEFFRSNDFTANHDGKHILFSGCSEGEGVGGNIEDSWTHMLYNKISKKEKCSGFFNLSRAGWGWSKIITNALIYFKKYGYPDVYFILLPNHQRKHIYNHENEKLEYGQLPKWENNLLTKAQYLEEFVFFLNHWKTFNELCKLNNVKLIFSSYDKLDKNNLKRSPFKNYFMMDDEELIEFAENHYKNNELKKDDITKRDGHSGRIIHSYWAEKFYNYYINHNEQEGIDDL